jgi:hypothetical protein
MPNDLSAVAVEIYLILLRLCAEDYGPIVSFHALNHVLDLQLNATRVRPQRELLADEVFCQLFKLGNGNPDPYVQKLC